MSARLTRTPPGVPTVLLLAALSGFPSLVTGQPTPASSESTRPAPLTPPQLDRLRERNRLWQEMQKLRAEGKLPEAITVLEKVLSITREVFGATHDDVVTSLEALAAIWEELGEFATARQARREVLQIRIQRDGENHWRTADARRALAQTDVLERLTPAQRADLGRAERLNALAVRLYGQGKFSEAVPLARQVLQVRKEVLGDKHPEYATSVHNLAALYRAMGDYGKAEPLYRQARDIGKAVLGEEHPGYATHLNTLAMLYQSTGDYAKAEPLYRQARDIYKEALGEKHPDYAASLNNLAALYDSMGDYARAEPLSRQALVIAKDVLGEKHPDYATALNNLAILYRLMGDYAKAEPLYRQALAIRKQAQGEKHADYAQSLHNLAGLYQAMGDYARAEPLYRQALAIYKESLGEKHPGYATDLNNLALLYQSIGDYAKAEPLLRQGLAIQQSCLDLASAAQSERQQLAMAAQFRITLSAYAGPAPLAAKAPEAVYAPVLRCKGVILARQRQQGVLRQHPELAGDFARLQRTAAELARLAFAVPLPQQRDAWRRRLQELTEEKEQAESALARKSADYARQQAERDLTPAQLRACLPEGTALVDLLEYWQAAPPTAQGKNKFEQRLAAFVVRRAGIAQVDLGPVQPIREAVLSWRRTYGLKTQDRDPGADLRRLLWEPLEKHLAGAGTVLVCPEGPLAAFPWTALPGKEPGSYLVEERAVAVVAVPQLLPALLRQRAPGGVPSLLLVGDVDYGADPGKAEQVADSGPRPVAARNRSGGLRGWDSLPATREELSAIGASFQQHCPGGKVDALRKGAATHAAFCREAPSHRYLHAATHGFFNPDELRKSLAATRAHDLAGADLFAQRDVAGFHPGLLSGLVLAGANRPGDPDRDDAIVTALEVAGLDLSGVELATLSACETGLGKEAGAEGLLGLQRAFQAAGTRSTLATLWSVRDDAARALMADFYENLWGKHLPKAEALRQAQLTMLKEGIKRKGSTKRGLAPADGPGDASGPRRTPPSCWAAFVLSGDWR